MDRVLLLNADHDPIKCVHWTRAVSLMVQDRAYLVAEVPGGVVRSVRATIPRPSVIALTTYVRLVRTPPPPTRRNLLARDGHRCVYCGVHGSELGHLDASQRLTVDHVVPQCRAENGRVRVPWLGRWVGVHAWENIVTACGRCNNVKGGRLPSEAGMHLAHPPTRPEPRSLWMARLSHGSTPEAWAPWVHPRKVA